MHLDDMFGRKIVAGDSFMRIEDRMGGSAIRYYFLGGFADDGRIQVQEYGGVPRTINKPNGHKDTLMLLTEDLMKLSGFIAPSIEEVTAPKTAKKSKKDDALVI